MKITKTPDMVRGAITAGGASSIGGVFVGPFPTSTSSNLGIISSSSNTASWQPIVSTITANGSNTLLGPNVNFASGSNITFSVASNTLTIHSIVAPTHTHTGYLSVIDGGGGTVYALGNLTGTINVNTANGNYQWGTFTGNTTFTFTTTTDAAERWFTLELIEGAGGHSPTWPASVSWLGGTAPTHDTTAGTTTIYGFFTRNGGTTWIGGELGGGSAITVENEGVVLATSAETLDFVGPLVTASGTGAEKTITVTGALDDLSDVMITAPAEDDDLRYNGSAWVNDFRKWESVTNGEDVFVWQTDDLVFEWST